MAVPHLTRQSPPVNWYLRSVQRMYRQVQVGTGRYRAQMPVNRWYLRVPFAHYKERLVSKHEATSRRK